MSSTSSSFKPSDPQPSTSPPMPYVTATVLAYTAIAASVVGTGISIYSQQQQAKSQEAAADYNNDLAEQEARNAELEAAEQAKRQQITKRRELSRLRTDLIGQGTLTTTGSPLAILGESSATMDLSIADAARASHMQAASFRSQGRMGLWEASQARTAANLNSLATGISGIGSAASTGYSLNYQGAFGKKKTTTTATTTATRVS